MNIFYLLAPNRQNVSFNNINKRNNSTAAVLTNPAVNLTRSPEYDTFSPSFTSTNRTNNSTKRGRFLKRLNNITDPYSGAKILTKEEFEKYQNTIPQIENTRQRINLMSQYTNNMRPVEKAVYRMFSDKIRKYEKDKTTPEFLTFSQILKEEKPAALKRLAEKEYTIFNKILEETNTMKPHNAQRVREVVAKILPDVESGNHHFQRKDFIQSLLDMREEQKDNPHFQFIVKTAQKLPNSHIDTDAFIVKYADRSEEEITNRLVASSVGTIEHIVPDSQGGISEAPNFLLTTAGSNVERDIMSHDDFIKLHPKIPRYCQAYMDDIIAAGNEGKLAAYEWYPYTVAETIKKEMGVNVDLSKYKIKPKRAFKTFPERIREDYPQFKKYFDRKGGNNASTIQ